MSSLQRLQSMQDCIIQRYAMTGEFLTFPSNIRQKRVLIPTRLGISPLGALGVLSNSRNRQIDL